MNSRWHLYLSIAKSGLRIGSCVFAIVYSDWWVLCIGLGLAEILGILEEIGDDR